jgi:hypothetical protein
LRFRQSDRRLWGWVLRGVQVPALRWFVSQFLEAATLIVQSHGPELGRRPTMGSPLGAWCLLGAWAVGGFVIVLAILRWS